MVAPFLLLGLLIGESLRFIGLDRQRIVQNRISVILAIGVVSLIGGTRLARTDHTEAALCFGIASGLAAGLSIARDRQEAVDVICSVLCCSFPVVFFVVSVLTLEELAFIPAVALRVL